MKKIVKQPGKLLAVQPHWNESFDNRPDFQCLLTTVPMTDEYLHITDGKGHYRGIIGDCVHYMYSDGKPTHGFGGREIVLNMATGPDRKFIGGWSSNARTINASFPDHHALTECSVTAEKKVMREGYTFYSGSVTIQAILNWWLDNQHKLDWGIGLMNDSSGPWIEPTKGRFVKFSHGVRDLVMVARFLPYNAQIDENSKIRDLKYFWGQWERVQRKAQPNGELGGDQMAAVTA